MPKLDTLSLNDRVMCITGSINFRDYSVLNKDDLVHKMFDILDDWASVRDYYFIFHDETDTYHLHYILFFNKQQYVSNVLNRFVDGFGIETDAVNYKKLLHRNAMIRYILHIDAKSIKEGKKAYSVVDLYSNVNSRLIDCFIASKDDNNRLDMLTLEGICVQCKGDELLIAEFLDEIYDKSSVRAKIKLILERFAIVQLKFENSEDLPF